MRDETRRRWAILLGGTTLACAGLAASAPEAAASCFFMGRAIKCDFDSPPPKPPDGSTITKIVPGNSNPPPGTASKVTYVTPSGQTITVDDQASYMPTFVGGGTGGGTGPSPPMTAAGQAATGGPGGSVPGNPPTDPGGGGYPPVNPEAGQAIADTFALFFGGKGRSQLYDLNPYISNNEIPSATAPTGGGAGGGGSPPPPPVVTVDSINAPVPTADIIPIQGDSGGIVNEVL